jgi:hypothetical protein
MMAERDLVTPLLNRNVVKNAPPQPRTDRTIRFAFRNKSFDYRVSVTLDDAKGNIQLAEILRQHFSRKSRLFLVEVYGQKLEVHRRAPPDVD